MSGDRSGTYSGYRSGRRLSVPAGARRYSSLVPPGSPGNSARRLSALVPEAVVRRLSNVSSSLGLGKPLPPESLVDQGKALCAMYMCNRIRSSGSAVGKYDVSRNISYGKLCSPWAGTRVVFPRLSQLGRHLEHARPRLYAAVGRHAIPIPNYSAPAPDPADIVYAIGMELLKEDITWGKIVSLMAVCGALASEPRASPDLVSILDAAAAVMGVCLVPWLTDHGGWYGLLEHCQPLEPLSSPTTSKMQPSHLTAYFLCILIVVGFLWIFKDYV